MHLDVSIPEILAGRVEISDIYQNYTAAGNPSSFGIDLDLDELGLSKSIKSREFHLLGGKIESTLRTWAGKLDRHLKQQHAQAQSESVDQLNADATAALTALDEILAATLDVDDTVDWSALKRKESFRVRPDEFSITPEYRDVLEFNTYGRPTGFTRSTREDEPTMEQVKGQFGLFSRLFRRGKIELAFQAQHAEWESSIEKAAATDAERESALAEVTTEFEQRKASFEVEKEADNAAVDELRERYERSDPSAIEDYCDLVLGNSKYPDAFPQTWQLEYRESSRMVVVDYDLVAPDEMPNIESYRYVKAKDEISSKLISPAAQKKLYSSVIYQVCIRTLHELFEADAVGAVDAVAFNGIVTSVNPATGIEESKAILSISAAKDEFEQFDLARIDPKATFKHLKGVAAASLIDLTAVPPVVVLEKQDRRFVEGRDVADGLDSSVNLAAMDCPLCQPR